MEAKRAAAQLPDEKMVFLRLSVAAVLVAVIIIALIIAFGVQHDYALYLQQWGILLDGGDPWGRMWGELPIHPNAYGPLQVVIGYLAVIHDLAPKLLFGFCNAAIFWLTACAAHRAGWVLDLKTLMLLALAYAFFPLTFFSTYVFGINDSVVALCVLLALEARRREWYEGSGLWLGLGALLKFYPLLFLPLLMLDRNGSLRLRGIAAGVGLFAVGMLVGYLVWGESVLAPFSFGQDREAKLLSILNFMEYAASHVGAESAANWLVDRNASTVVLLAALFSLHCWLSRVPWEVATCVGMLLIFFVYKVGHPQFYLCWLVALVWIYFSASLQDHRAFARRLAPIAIFLGLFMLLYYFSLHGTNEPGYLEGPWRPVRYFVSIPFAITVALCLYSVRERWLHRWQWPLRIRW